MVLLKRFRETACSNIKDVHLSMNLFFGCGGGVVVCGLLFTYFAVLYMYMYMKDLLYPPQIDTNKLVVLIYSKIAFITNLFSLRLIPGWPLITTCAYMYIVLYFRANWHLMIVLSICLRKKISLENVGKKRYTW